MEQLYPEPPHLTISLYSDEDETLTYAKICKALQNFDCTGLEILQVVRKNQLFESLSDLSGEIETINAQQVRWNTLTSGEDTELRVVKAGFWHRKLGKVVASYLAAPAMNRHPLEVFISADALGFPLHLLEKQQRAAAYARARWTKMLAQTVFSVTGAQYGAIAVEQTIPPPCLMRSRPPAEITEIYVASDVLAGHPGLESGLAQVYADFSIENWKTGNLYCAWGPFTQRESTGSTIDSKAASDLLAQFIGKPAPHP
ncbi:hypothetical protein [Streptomyces sp. NPDC054784]